MHLSALAGRSPISLHSCIQPTPPLLAVHHSCRKLVSSAVLPGTTVSLLLEVADRPHRDLVHNFPSEGTQS